MNKVLDNAPFKLDAKTLFFDIECSPTRGWAYRAWEASVFNIEEDWHIQSFAWKWGNQESVHCLALPDFPLYKKEPHNDRDLVTELYALWNQADIIVGHNGDKFDIKKSKHRFMIHGLRPPRPFRTLDTLKIAKKFGFFSNSLDGVCRELSFGQKVKHDGDLWKQCYNGSKGAWVKMKQYNKMDVVLLERVYRYFFPWIERFPRVRMDNGHCPGCSGTSFKKNGWKYGPHWQQQRYACLGCGQSSIYGERERV